MKVILLGCLLMMWKMSSEDCTGGWVEEWMGGWMGGWVGGWMSEWIDGWMGR